MEERYITVKEFAELAGISTNATYQATQGRLTKFVKSDSKGRKLISYKALEEFYPHRLGKAFKEVSEETYQASEASHGSDLLVKTLQEQIEYLKEQINVKDRQIEKYQEEISDYSKRLHEVSSIFMITQKEESSATIQEEESEQAPMKKESWFSKFFK